MRLFLCDACRLGLLPQTLDLGLHLGFGLGTRPRDFGGERASGGFLGLTLRFACGGFLVCAPSLFALDTHAFHFRLNLRVGFLTDAGELGCDPRIGFRFDARDFVSQGFRGLFRRRGLHRFGFGLNARHFFGTRRFRLGV